jgi:imidazolonepropionase-like amidohydrolase
MKNLSLTSIFLGFFAISLAQTPAPNQNKKILLYGGIAHLGNGEVIESSLIILEDGKILTIEDASNIRIDISDAEYYDVIGKHIYPGFILPNTTLGLADIDAVRATRDFDEVGDFNPHVRSIIAYNTDSPVVPTVRTNGILIGQITPRGGVVSGTSSLVEFDAWNYEDALYKQDDAVHINWPKSSFSYWGHDHQENVDDEFEKKLSEVEEFFNKARSYAKSSSKKTDLRLEAMRGVFNGSKGLFVHVRTVKEIKSAVLFAKNLNLDNLVLVGANDAWRVADFLAENEIPVVLNRTHRLPMRKSEDVDIAYKSAKILLDAGVLFCLDYEGDMERMGARNLPFTAGTTVAYGLTKEEALMSITLSAAKILKIDGSLGSLEPGKDATLFVSEGDALDVMTNDVGLAFIRGKKLELGNHQIDLYEKYRKRYKKLSNK